MTAHQPPVQNNRPTNDEVHPFVYRSIIGLAIWLVISVWVLFSRGTYEGVTLTVITFFFLIVTGIPVILWITWQRNSDPDQQHSYVGPFREWSSGPFVTRTGRIPGREAAIQILLPIGAVAFGMTIFGLVLLFAVPHFGAY